MLKKLLALAIAGAMVIGSMTAFGSETIVPEGLEPDSTVTINGLDEGDEVTLYQVIKWANNSDNTSAGWVLADPFADNAACQAVLTKINAHTDGPYALTKDDVKAFTDVINAGGTFTTKTKTIDNSKQYEETVDAGTWLALVNPAVAGTLYNPIIVSADYNEGNGTNEIIASSGVYVGGNTGFAKKETLKVEKEEEDDDDETECSYDVGDNVGFTVKTTIPTYAEIYTDPTFSVTDEMSKGLVLDTTKGIKVYEADGTTEITGFTVTPDGTKGWTVEVPSAYIKALAAPKPIVIKYEAILTETAFTSVTEEVNDVKVEFSNNPSDKTDKGTVKDKTRTYTFSIDGSLIGGGGENTSELVKVAVDGNGNPIYQSSSTNTTHKNALAGAIFGLFKSRDEANAYTKNGTEIKSKADGEAANMYTNDNFIGVVTTDSKGFMEINGLDEGTYYLKELKAPDGFIKDQDVHEIVISATYGTETITEDGYTYDLPVLESYTITVDGTKNKYSMKLEESKITTSEIIEESNSLLNNTQGIELPSTGGIGTTLFYAGGAVLVLLAGVLLVSKRRIA